MPVRFGHSAATQMLRALAIVGIGVGLVYLVHFAELVSVMFEVFSDINSTADSAKNQRGDEATARTKSSPRRQDPDRTVVRLRPAHSWFWITLVETESFGVQESLRWRSDDTLDVMLGFGCLTQMTHPIDADGSIHIAYRFTNNDKTLAKGCPDRGLLENGRGVVIPDH